MNRLSNQKKYKSLLGNIGVFAIASGASKFAPFILVPVLTRYLTVEEYGQTDLFSTLINLVVPLLTLSVSSGVLRYCIRPEENRAGYLRASVFLTLVSCALAIVLSPVLSLPMFGGLADNAILIVLSYAAVAFSTLFANASRAMGDNLAVILSACVSSALNLFLTIFFVVEVNFGIKGFFLGYLISNLSSCVTYCVFGKTLRAELISKVRVTAAEIRNLLSYSIPLVPNSLCWWITNSINRFFIIVNLGLAASGLFAAASKLPSLLNVAAGIFQQAWSLSLFQEHGTGDSVRFNSLVYDLYSCILAVIAMLMICFVQPICKTLLGAEFIDSWVYMPVLLISFYAGAMSSFVGTVYTASKKTHQLFFTTLLGALCCLVFTWLLVGSLGVQGVCIASAISNVLMCATRTYDINRIGEYEFNFTTMTFALLSLVICTCIVLGGHVGMGLLVVVVFTIICCIQFNKNYR